MQSPRIGTILLILAMIMCWSFAYGKTKKSKPISCPEGYICERVKGGQSWHSMFPDDRERDVVMRINRTNQSLYAGKIIKVPSDLDSGDFLDYAPFARAIDAPGEKVIVVDLNQHGWAAYDADGQLVYWGPATGGNNYCNDIGKSCRTKAGEFRIYSLGSSNCVSTKFPVGRGGAPMPYCMFFNGGQALHGSPGEVVDGNISHGCVRLFVQDAEWLRYNFVDPPMAENRYRGTKVVVLPY